MGTSLSFRRIILFLPLFTPLLGLFAQEEKGRLNFDVFGELAVAYGIPDAYGNNSIAKGYDIRNAINIDLKFQVLPKWLVGAQWSNYQGDVVDIGKVGAIDNSGISHLYVTGNYSLLEKNKPIGLRTGTGIGYALYRHKKDANKFLDDGFSIMTNIDLGYRITNSLGIFLKLDHYWDFLSISTNPKLDSFVKKTSTFTPYLGIRLYTF